MLKILFFYSTLKIVGFEFQEFAPEDYPAGFKLCSAHVPANKVPRVAGISAGHWGWREPDRQSFSGLPEKPAPQHVEYGLKLHVIQSSEVPCAYPGSGGGGATRGGRPN